MAAFVELLWGLWDFVLVAALVVCIPIAFTLVVYWINEKF